MINDLINNWKIILFVVSRIAFTVIVAQAFWYGEIFVVALLVYWMPTVILAYDSVFRKEANRK